MAKTFYVSPGRSYTVTASEGTTITYPGITKPAATVGSEGSVTFNCTGTEIVVSDDSAQIAQNFNNAGAAVAGAGGGNLKEAQLYVPGILSGNLVSGHVYDLGVLATDQDLSSIAFEALNGYVQTCEIWMETGDTGYSITWPEGSVWPDEADGAAPGIVLPENTRYRFAVRNEGNGTMVITKAYEYSL